MLLKGSLRRICGSIIKGAKAVLQQGLAPEQLALTICLGAAVGTLPIIWGTTLLCVALASRFGLNQAALQAVNYLVYPLQLALFFPLFRLGEKFLPWGPSVSAEVLKSALHGRFAETATLLGWATIKAVGAWLVTIPPLALLLYPLLVKSLRRRNKASRLDQITS